MSISRTTQTNAEALIERLRAMSGMFPKYLVNSQYDFFISLYRILHLYKDPGDDKDRTGAFLCIQWCLEKGHADDLRILVNTFSAKVDLPELDPLVEIVLRNVWCEEIALPAFMRIVNLLHNAHSSSTVDALRDAAWRLRSYDAGDNEKLQTLTSVEYWNTLIDTHPDAQALCAVVLETAGPEHLVNVKDSAEKCECAALALLDELSPGGESDKIIALSEMSRALSTLHDIPMLGYPVSWKHDLVDKIERLRHLLIGAPRPLPENIAAIFEQWKSFPMVTNYAWACLVKNS